MFSIVYFYFRNYHNIDAVFVSNNIVSFLFSMKKYENKSDGALSFSTVFIPINAVGCPAAPLAIGPSASNGENY